MIKGEPTLVRLKRQKKYANAIIFCWFMVEAQINELVLNEHGIFGFSPYNKKQKKVLDNLGTSSFCKIEFLNKKRIFEGSEYRNIDDFRKARNDLFHSNTQNFIKWFCGRGSLKRLMEIGIKAYKSTDMAFDRNISILGMPDRSHYLKYLRDKATKEGLYP